MVTENENKPIRPPRRKKKLSFKGFKTLKEHLGINLGAALIPEISFAAVPNHPKPVLTHSRVAKAVFSATWAGQTILCGSELQDNNPLNVQKTPEESLQESDIGYEKLPFDKTIEEEVYKIASDNLPLDNKGVNIDNDDDDDNGKANSFKTEAEVISDIKPSSNSVEHIYAVPNKKPIKVSKPSLTSLPQIKNQIDSLETLKLMTSAKKSESSTEINKNKQTVVKKTWQSESKLSNVTLGSSLSTLTERKSTAEPLEGNLASQRAEFMENLHKKLEILRKEVLETVEENKTYQKQKLDWAEKLKEANQILEENMILKHDIRYLEQTVDESQQEVQHLKRELLNLKDVTKQVNAQSNDLIEENSNLKRKCAQLERKSEETMSVHQHNLIINEIKMLLEDLKLKYQDELDHLYSQIASNRLESSQMRTELLKYKEQSEQLKTDNASLNAGFQETLQKCQTLLTQLKASHQWGETAQDLLATLIHVSEHTAQERDQLVEKTRAQTQLHHKFVSVLLKKTVSLGRLQESLKGFKTRTMERVQKMEELVEETEAESAQAQNNLEKEIQVLKVAVQDRDEKLRLLVSNKMKLEKDLESMWEQQEASSSSSKQTPK